MNDLDMAEQTEVTKEEVGVTPSPAVDAVSESNSQISEVSKSEADASSETGSTDNFSSKIVSVPEMLKKY